MGTHADLHHDGSVIRYDSALLDPPDPHIFDVDWLMAKGFHRGKSAGRGVAHFLSFGGREMVLRPFRRGGLVGKVNRDLFLRRELDNSRSFREFALLFWMRETGLPVPRPVAAQIVPVGIFYRAAIVTERIPDARPLEEHLRDRAVGAQVWGRVGATARRMHDAGVDHTDLNCRNILVDGAGKVWLIDFDKCSRRAPGSWADGNLQRLLRSLRKQSGPGFHWAEADWAALRAGYDGGSLD